jgi:hypothetical protein
MAMAVGGLAAGHAEPSARAVWMHEAVSDSLGTLRALRALRGVALSDEAYELQRQSMPGLLTQGGQGAARLPWPNDLLAV